MSDLYLPQGRFVFGNLYKGNTTDQAGKPLMTTAGNPRVDFVVGYAIPKTPGQNWRDTAWGQQLVREAQAGFPQGQHQMATFAWKVIDGDSTELNQNMKRPVDMQGYAGHWVLRLKGGFAPATAQINPATGRPERFDTENGIVPGDYVQAHISVNANKNQQKPGLYLNPNAICLMSKGERIVSGPDVTQMAFGAAAPQAAPFAVQPPPVPGAAPAWPPAGWTAHPSAPGYFYQGQEVKSEADLRAMMPPPPAPAPAPVAPPPVPAAVTPPPVVPVVPNPAVLAPPPVFPPAGWTAHPQAPGHFYKGTEVLTEADLRTRAAAGTA